MVRRFLERLQAIRCHVSVDVGPVYLGVHPFSWAFRLEYGRGFVIIEVGPVYLMLSRGWSY